MSGPIRIGLLGAGVVGEGILRILHDHAGSIERRMGSAIEVRKVVARDSGKDRGPLVEGLLGFDVNDVLDDDEVDVVVEVMGGLEPAGTCVRRAIEAGKSVVTANKALLAEQGHELIELSEQRGVDLYFEAAVAGGVPVVRVLREALASDTVVRLEGIVNGTSNYILSQMRDRGVDFDIALRDAQAAGYAEADPTLDVNGGDATHKLAILATLAFGARVHPDDVSTEGIEHVGAVDIQMAARFGYVIKPLAIGVALDNGSLDLRVHAALVPESGVLASISGALNVVVLEGAMLGPCLLSGYGAGALPTAMSVVSDIVDVGRNLLIGASGRVPQRAWRGEHLTRHPIASGADHTCRWYLRFSVLDRPGVLARIAGVLGAFDVSIEQMLQQGQERDSNAPVHVVMLTHDAKATDVRHALEEIEALSDIIEPARALRIEA